MKTERLVLLVTPQEKAEISAKAERLGISVGEFVRRASEQFDADDLIAMEELTQLVPELNAMADRIERRHVEWEAERIEREREIAHIQSPEYRDQVRAEVLADDGIDWDAVSDLFGFARHEERAA